MRPFDLEAAKRGEPVCTKDGRSVRMLCFDAEGKYPIAGIVPHLYHEDMTLAHSYREDGSLAGGSEGGAGNLMMVNDDPEPVADKEKGSYLIGNYAGHLLMGIYPSLPEAIEGAKLHVKEEGETTFVLRPIKKVSRHIAVEDWDKI